MKKTNKKGFTLAELLIVVAIIAVLALITIPLFNSSLTRAHAGTEQANARAFHTEMMLNWMTNADPSTPPASQSVTIQGVTYEWSYDAGSSQATVTLTGAKGGEDSYTFATSMTP